MAGIPGVILVRRLKLNLRHMGKGCDQYEEEEDSLLVCCWQLLKDLFKELMLTALILVQCCKMPYL